MSIFTIACRMVTSVPVIDATHGHLARDAECNDRELLDGYEEADRHVVGTNPATPTNQTSAETTKPRRGAVPRAWARRVSNLRPLACESTRSLSRNVAKCRTNGLTGRAERAVRVPAIPGHFAEFGPEGHA